MNLQRKKRFGCLALALLLLLLCGCQFIADMKQDLSAKQAEMDELLVKVMTCVENNDAQSASALAYDPQKMLEGFSAIASGWPVHATDPFEAAGLTINKNNNSETGPQTFTTAVYIIHCQDQDYQAQFSTCEDRSGSGLIGFNVKTVQSLIDNGIEPAGTNTPFAKKSFGQWCFTGFWILCCIFCLVTIIDIIRKKPRLWGLWILAALFFFGGLIEKGPNSLHTGIRLGLLSESGWAKFLDGTNRYQLCLPVGAIAYWIDRKRLLKKKEAPAYAVPVQPAPAQPAPVQPAPVQPTTPAQTQDPQQPQ